jgi:NAD(P)-dependent dehydrogenase (short-subunit alcohol dehydrogenase family)
MSYGRFSNPVNATLTGILDIFRKQKLASNLKEDDRLDGKVCLVTGSNSGLGFAIAKEMAKRGGHVIMACRSGIPEAGDKLMSLTGSDAVDMVPLDLTKLDSIFHFCRDLAERNSMIDIMVCNAGVAPPGSTMTESGQDEIFMVNYLSKFIVLNRLLRNGTIRNDAFAKNSKPDQIPRIIFISSDSHQNASAIDFEEFGKYQPYGIRKAMNNYSYYKLVMNTFAAELSRRLNPQRKTNVSVNVICPGPVNSNIIRHAPGGLRIILKFILTLFFQSPDKAAQPVIYLAASEEMEGTTNQYFHMFNPKKMDPKVYDEGEGKKLWTYSEDLCSKLDPGLKQMFEN